MEATSRHDTGQVLRVVAGQWKRFAYLVVLMTFMMFLSHGTQDLYPDFLQEVHQRFQRRGSRQHRDDLQLGAIVGAIIFGFLSQAAGRRKGMIAALGLVAADDSAVGLWRKPGDARCGRFPDANGRARRVGRDSRAPERIVADAARGLMPGLAYQTGNFARVADQFHRVCASRPRGIPVSAGGIRNFHHRFAGGVVVVRVGRARKGIRKNQLNLTCGRKWRRGWDSNSVVPMIPRNLLIFGALRTPVRHNRPGRVQFRYTSGSTHHFRGCRMDSSEALADALQRPQRLRLPINYSRCAKRRTCFGSVRERCGNT